jgi:hypothetical protein
VKHSASEPVPKAASISKITPSQDWAPISSNEFPGSNPLGRCAADLKRVAYTCNLRTHHGYREHTQSRFTLHYKVGSTERQYNDEIQTGQGETIAYRWSPSNGQAGGAVHEPLSFQSNRRAGLARCAELSWQLGRWPGPFLKNRGLEKPSVSHHYDFDCPTK